MTKYTSIELFQALYTLSTTNQSVRSVCRDFPTISVATLARKFKQIPSHLQFIDPDEKEGKEQTHELKEWTEGRRKAGNPNNFLFTQEEEKVAVDWALQMSRHGLSVSQPFLASKLTEVREKKGKKKPAFHHDFWTAFYSRHPQLSQRKADKKSVRHSSVTKEKLEHFFSCLKKLYEVFPALDPSHILALDETGVSSEKRNDKVLTEKGSKRVLTIDNGFQTKVSVLHICDASGRSLPPFFVNKGKRTPENILDGTPEGSVVSMHKK